MTSKMIFIFDFEIYINKENSRQKSHLLSFCSDDFLCENKKRKFDSQTDYVVFFFTCNESTWCSRGAVFHQLDEEKKSTKWS